MRSRFGTRRAEQTRAAKVRGVDAAVLLLLPYAADQERFVQQHLFAASVGDSLHGRGFRQCSNVHGVGATKTSSVRSVLTTTPSSTTQNTRTPNRSRDRDV